MSIKSFKVFIQIACMASVLIACEDEPPSTRQTTKKASPVASSQITETSQDLDEATSTETSSDSSEQENHLTNSSPTTPNINDPDLPNSNNTDWFQEEDIENNEVVDEGNENEFKSDQSESVFSETSSFHNTSAVNTTLNSGEPLLDQLHIILIHGFSASIAEGLDTKYGDPGFDESWEQHSRLYWKYYTDEILDNNPNVLQAYWSSRDRLEEGIIQSVVNQILDAMENGFCQQQCIIISHSTGGLVTDYLLSTAVDSEGTNLDYKVISDRVVLSIQLGSAVGGSELANLYVDWYEGTSCDNLFYQIIHPIADWISPHDDCGSGIEKAGILLDLTPTKARSLNGSSSVQVPTLMVAGSGRTGVFGIYLQNEIPEIDDSFVGMHSACGANNATPIESCSSEVNHDGTVGPANGPSGLYRNHFPWFMTEEDHGEMIGRIRDPDPNAHEIPVNIEKYSSMKNYEKEEGFIWQNTHRYIEGDRSKTSAQLIYEFLKLE